MKHFSCIIVAAFLTVSGWNIQDKKPPVAFIIKVVNDVERRDSTSAGWIKALPTSELAAGCEIRTQEKSFVMIKFPDGSKVAVREQSAIRLMGDFSRGKILERGVFIERGRAVFNVIKQDTGAIRFTSPVSALSIRKGEGMFGFDPSRSQAVVTITSGVAEFSSTRVNCKLTVRAGHTAIIDSTGCRRH
jgi:hypothetical protein